MGVVSNKINIMEIMKSGGGGGDPTIPGRVSALETETAGLIEANAKIMTSVSALDLETAALAEANAQIMTSVSAMDLNITELDTTVGDNNSGLVKDVAGLKTTVGDSNSGLVKDVSEIKNSILIKSINTLEITATQAEEGLTFLNRCHAAILSLYNGLSSSEKMKILSFNLPSDFVCTSSDGIFTKGIDSLNSSTPLHFIGSKANLNQNSNLMVSVICMTGNSTSFGREVKLSSSGIETESNIPSTTFTGGQKATITCIIYK